MRSISRLVTRRDVSERKLIKAGASCVFPHRRNREKNDPRDDPDGEEHLDHHTKETDKEISIEPIHVFDVVIVCLEYRDRPSQKACS